MAGEGGSVVKIWALLDSRLRGNDVMMVRE